MQSLVRVFSVVMCLVVMATMFAACNKDDTDKSPEVSVEVEEKSQEDKDVGSLIEIPLVSTRLSWDIPESIQMYQTENGFAGQNEDSSIGILCRRESLFKLHNGYTSGDRVSEDVLKSRLYEFAFGSEKYSMSNPNLFKVQVDGQIGFWFRSDYSMGDRTGKLQALSIQFDDDIVVFAAVYDDAYIEVVDAIFNSVGTHSDISTEWSINN